MRLVEQREQRIAIFHRRHKRHDASQALVLHLFAQCVEDVAVTDDRQLDIRILQTRQPNGFDGPIQPLIGDQPAKKDELKRLLLAAHREQARGKLLCRGDVSGAVRGIEKKPHIGPVAAEVLHHGDAFQQA